MPNSCSHYLVFRPVEYTFSFEILYLRYNALYDNVLICKTSIPNVCYKFYQANNKKKSTQLKRASDGFYMKKYQI